MPDPPATDADGEAFAETDLSQEAILGEHTFDGLYSVEGARNAVPVDVRTGEKSQSIPSVEEAVAFAERVGEDSDYPYVAKLQSTESMAETRSKPYTGCVFCHFSLVGGMQYHKAFRAAYDDPGFDVTVDPDYESGELTITVARAE